MRIPDIIVTACLAVLATSGTVVAAEGAAPPASPRPLLALTRVAKQFPPGVVNQILQVGPFCLTAEKNKANGNLEPADLSKYSPGFDRELASAGLMERTQNLFDTRDRLSGVDYQIGALINGGVAKGCSQGSDSFKVSVDLQVQWQIYSVAERKVVATIETTGAGKSAGGPDEIPKATYEAFAIAARALFVSPEMKELLGKPIARTTAIQVAAREQTRIALITGMLTAKPVSEATGSVVLVSLPDSFGSGVLVSEDGYVLTNHHVVGGAKTVRIRWSDGLETTGEVIRSNKGRDVALIKTDPRDRPPMPIRTSPVQIGDAVTAIGTPADMTLQSTVTRGIVSAKRILDGFSYLQSDVVINHGSSGGPLLDDKGQVVALAVMMIAPEEVQVGLNFFIPIKDALDFLSLDLPAPAAPLATRAAIR